VKFDICTAGFGLIPNIPSTGLLFIEIYEHKDVGK
jgi:hypothetical protein